VTAVIDAPIVFAALDGLIRRYVLVGLIVTGIIVRFFVYRHKVTAGPAIATTKQKPARVVALLTLPLTLIVFSIPLFIEIGLLSLFQPFPTEIAEMFYLLIIGLIYGSTLALVGQDAFSQSWNGRFKWAATISVPIVLVAAWALSLPQQPLAPVTVWVGVVAIIIVFLAFEFFAYRIGVVIGTQLRSGLQAFTSLFDGATHHSSDSEEIGSNSFLRDMAQPVWGFVLLYLYGILWLGTVFYCLYRSNLGAFIIVPYTGPSTPLTAGVLHHRPDVTNWANYWNSTSKFAQGGRHWWDFLYFSLMNVTTLGSSEIHPESFLPRALTAIEPLASTGWLVAIFAILSATVAERRARAVSPLTTAPPLAPVTLVKESDTPVQSKSDERDHNLIALGIALGLIISELLRYLHQRRP